MKKNFFNLKNNKLIIFFLLLLLLFFLFNKDLIEGNSNRKIKCKFDSKDYERSAKRNQNIMKKQANSLSSNNSDTNRNIQAMS